MPLPLYKDGNLSIQYATILMQFGLKEILPFMNFNVNIIYTPGTVKYLSFFIWSLLKWSDCSFHLVSNGCHPAEQRYLQNLCAQDKRLEYRAMPTKTSLPHGQVLNYLQAINQLDYFCFIDSDIFATGDFLTEIMLQLKNYAGTFSGMPIWVKQEEETLPHDFRHMVGTFNRTDKGDCIGSTYVALYDNRALTEIMQSTGISFEEYHWHEIPREIQEKLSNLGLQKDSYDTAKVINLLLLAQGSKLRNLELPNLCHIGGTSFQVHYDNQTLGLKRRLLNQLMRTKLAAPLEAIQQRRTTASYQKRYQASPEAELHLNRQQRSQQRNPVRQYLLLLLNALFQGATLPPLPSTGDQEIDNRLSTTKEQLLLLFEEHKDKL